jgi:hypothetical protein
VAEHSLEAVAIGSGARLEGFEAFKRVLISACCY